MHVSYYIIFLFLKLISGDLKSDNYEVLGISCELNEEVSCLLIKCPAGRYCPASDFCYNPKCVCRRGYRRSNGSCVKKQRSASSTSQSISK